MKTDTYNAWRFCVAPMLDWSDRHCRFFHRLLTRRARLYTEMVTTGALVHGDRARHLDFDPSEHPVALQLGGSDPADLARCARWAEQWGYDEVNLNCGCPSDRVQRGAFGACLMAEPALVRDCLAAMRDAVSIPVTIKHRIGIDRSADYGFVRDFVGTLAASGVQVFVVHARSAWLDGLSPKENREVPPHDPWLLASVDERLFGSVAPVADRFELIDPLVRYARRHVASGGRVREVTRHLLGLFNAMPGARAWRRDLSDANELAGNDPALIARAAERVARAVQRAARTNASVAANDATDRAPSSIAS